MGMQVWRQGHGGGAVWGQLPNLKNLTALGLHDSG